MQELDQYLNWCDQMYDNTPHCQCGNACSNDNYCQGQQTNCYACIQRVHKYWNTTIHYNCEKMVLYYVLKHGYRFGAEVFFELQREQAELSQWNDIFISSIGCGPCTELFGSLLHWRRMGKLDNMYHYRGFDLEPLWYPLMDQVKSYFPNADVETYGQDVFDYYSISPERVDVVILNYMLSDMKKFKQAEFGGFLNNLINFVRQKHIRYIIVNDIYLKISLEASRDLLNTLNVSGIHYRFTAGQYHGFNQFIGSYREVIPSPIFTISNQAIKDKYDPFRTVNSIQTIIRIQ